MNISIPNPVPTSGEVRMARARFAEALSGSLRGIRTPVLAGVGAADLALDSVSTLSSRLYRLTLSRPAAPRAHA
jgi:hypothetical protein